MGIDALDMTFRCEREFGIKLTRADLESLLSNGNTSNPPEGAWTDVQVREVVEWVQSSLDEQGVHYEQDVFLGVQEVLVQCLGVDDDEITLDAWLVRDLGAE